MSSFPISITFQVQTPPTAAFDQLARSAESLDKAMLGSSQNFDKFGQTVSQMEGPLGSVGSSMGQLEGSMSGLEGSLGSAAGSMGEFAGATEQLNGSISETGGFISEATGSMGEFGSSATEAGSASTELGTAATDAGTGVVELGTASSDTGGFVTELGTATGETNTVLGETNTVLGQTAPVMGETATGAADLAQGFTDLTPPMEESKTVLEGTVPILEGAGTAATDAGSATDDYSGALGGLGESLGPVEGGLTANNTVMEELGASTDTTASNSDTLQGSLVTLGTGFGAVTGAAMSLYGAYTNIRDAQAAVEKAQTKVIDANKKAETSYNALNRIINKIVSDTENGIQGQQRLAAAQAKLNALWDAGVRSGPAFAAALAELRAAEDGLTSSTVKGNEVIAKLGPAISGVESSARKATSSQLGLTRANEGLNASFLETGGALISGVSGLVQIGSAATKARGVMTLLKGAFVDAGIVLSQSLIPALGAIAVPAGIAAAAIAAFVGTVTAIRANIGVFDELGVAIGNTFPQLKPLLEDGRQAFINLSDAINSSISFILGGFDQLTGGTLHAQEAWDKWTGTLPQGQKNINVLSQGMAEFGFIMGTVGETAKEGYNKFKILEDGTLRLSNGTTVAAGSWRQLDSATVEYVKTAATVPGANDASTESTVAMSEATKKAADELAAVGTAVDEANAKVAFYAEETKMAELTQASFALGVAQAKVELIDETAELANGAGLLQTYSQQLAEGTLQVVAYGQGVISAGMALKEKIEALNEARGAYDANNVLIKEGTILEVEFASGVQETKTAIQEQAMELANTAGEIEGYKDAATAAQAVNNALMEGFLGQQQALVKLALGYAETVGSIVELENELHNTETQMIKFNAGVADGKQQVLEWANGLSQAAGEGAGFRDTLVDLAVSLGTNLSDAMSMSNDQLQTLIGTIAQVPSEVEKVVGAFDKMGQKIIQALAKAGKDGADGFMENITKLEQELHTTFSQPLVQELQVQANIEKAKNDVQGLLGVLAATLSNKPLEIGLKTQAAQDALTALQQKIAAAPAGAQQAFAPLQSALDKLASYDFAQSGLAGIAPILAQIVAASANLEGGMQGAISSFNSLFAAAAQGQGGLEALKTAFESVGLTLDTTTGQLTNSAGQVVASMGAMATGTQTAGQQTSAALLAVGQSGDAARDAWARDMQIMFLAVDQFGKHAQLMATTVSGAYSNMSANVTASLDKLASGIMIILAAFQKMASTAQSMASTVSGAFSNMANNATSAMNKMASGIITILTSFQRLGSTATSMASTVGSAFSSMASKASSFASSFSSAMSKVQSSASSATSAVRALQSAINSLQSKTITITTIQRTVVQRVFAAHGAAYVNVTPRDVGPVKVSEFGQAELVTVTPLENPSGQTITGPGMMVSTSGPNASAYARSGTGEISLGPGGGGAPKTTMTDKDVQAIAQQMIAEITKKAQGGGGGGQKQTLIRELPIVIKVDAKTIIDIVNRRIFEISDSIIA